MILATVQLLWIALVPTLLLLLTVLSTMPPLRRRPMRPSRPPPNLVFPAASRCSAVDPELRRLGYALRQAPGPSELVIGLPGVSLAVPHVSSVSPNSSPLQSPPRPCVDAAELPLTAFVAPLPVHSSRLSALLLVGRVVRLSPRAVAATPHSLCMLLLLLPAWRAHATCRCLPAACCSCPYYFACCYPAPPDTPAPWLPTAACPALLLPP